jgi:hypothetical protein
MPEGKTRSEVSRTECVIYSEVITSVDRMVIQCMR